MPPLEFAVLSRRSEQRVDIALEYFPRLNTDVGPDNSAAAIKHVCSRDPAADIVSTECVRAVDHEDRVVDAIVFHKWRHRRRAAGISTG